MVTERDRILRRARQKRAYERRKEYALSYLGGKCAECGSTDYLQIDHVNPRRKKFWLLGSRWSCNFQKWKDELEKCQLLCYDCHLLKTWGSDKLITRQESPPF